MKKTALLLLIFTTVSGCAAYDLDRRGGPNSGPERTRIEKEHERLSREENRIKEERERLVREEKQLEEPMSRRSIRKQPIQPLGYYVGFGIGRSEEVSGCISGVSCDDKDKGMKVFGGIELYQHFNLEVSYVDLGSISASAGSLSVSSEADGLSLSGIGLIPLPGDVFFLTAKAGLFRWDLSSKLSGTGGSLTVSDNGIDLVYGVGGIAKFNERFGLRGEWEKYTSVGNENTTGQGEVEFISLSGMFFF